MRKAVVTGASSGIGKAIAERLAEDDFIVFAFGRNFEKTDEKNISPIICDFTDTNNLVKNIKTVNDSNDINVLVNCAGTAYYGLHEELNSKKIHEMIAVNMEAPLIITQLLLRNLKRNIGHIVNISSVTAKKNSPKGAAYAATKAALASFSGSLFEEVRKYGVRVSTIYPDMTDTNLYRNADFYASKDREKHIEPQEAAQAVMYALSAPVNISEIFMQPQKHGIEKRK